MRVLVDFTQIPVARTGVGVYAENLVRQLSFQLKSPDVLVLLLQKDELHMRELMRDCHNVLIVPLPTSLLRNRALLLLFEQVVIPVLLLWKKIDVVHSLHYTHPLLSPCPRVVTIHDLTFFLYPELHTLGRKLIMPFFIRQAVGHAEGVIFDSTATQTDTQRLIPSTHENLRRVVPLGVDLEGFDISPQTRKTILEKFSIKQPFLLFVGTIEPRKNVLRLIQAFERIAPEYPDLLLVLAGKLGWDFNDVVSAMQSSRYSNRIRHLGFVAESEKKTLLVACEALIYPSLYEGFGLPVLEAMAAGAPVITSNISSLPEVAGDAAILVNPLSVEEITDAVGIILNDDAKRTHLCTSGKRQAANFTWANSAIKTYDVYKTVARKL